MTEPIQDLCIHTITNKPWDIHTAIKAYAESGVRGVTVWRESLQGHNPATVGTMIQDYDMQAISLCRGGFFAAKTREARLSAIQENILAIHQAAMLGAPLLVLVCGADPAQSLDDSREQIAEGISAILRHAKLYGVKLGIEPLHPMYADTRSAINTLKQATDMSIALNSEYVGVVVDVYHLWWDPDLQTEIIRCGAENKLFAFHICDWNTPTTDFVNDRGLMGEGCIPLSKIKYWIAQTGYTGFHEVEIFSNKFWGMEQHHFLEKIIKAYNQYKKEG